MENDVKTKRHRRTKAEVEASKVAQPVPVEVAPETLEPVKRNRSTKAEIEASKVEAAAASAEPKQRTRKTKSDDPDDIAATKPLSKYELIKASKLKVQAIHCLNINNGKPCLHRGLAMEVSYGEDFYRSYLLCEKYRLRLPMADGLPVRSGQCTITY